jgi:hypothetical protein
MVEKGFRVGADLGFIAGALFHGFGGATARAEMSNGMSNGAAKFKDGRWGNVEWYSWV